MSPWGGAAPRPVTTWTRPATVSTGFASRIAAVNALTQPDYTDWVLALAGLGAIAVSDLLLLILGTNAVSALATVTGWTLLNNLTTTGARGMVFWKRATGSELSVAASFDGVVNWGVMRVELWRNAGDPTLTGAVQSGVNSDPPSHTAPVLQGHTWLAIRCGSHPLLVPSVAPAGYSGLVALANGDGERGTVAVAHREVAGSQTQNPAAFTNGDDSGAALFTLAIPGPASAESTFTAPTRPISSWSV